MVATLRRVYRLSFANKIVLTQAVLLAFCLQIGLKLWSFKTIIQFLKRFGTNQNRNEAATQQVEQYDHLMRLTYKCFPFFVKCLAISTTFWFLMQRKGIETRLQFGVQKEQGHFKSHAWLEYKGKPLTVDGDVKARYAPFAEAIL